MRITLLFYLVGLCYSVAIGQALPSRPFILGHTIEYNSSILNEKRTLNIYLPEGYSENDSNGDSNSNEGTTDTKKVVFGGQKENYYTFFSLQI